MGLRNRTSYSEEQCFFVTTTCFQKHRLLSVPGAMEIVCDSINFLVEKYQCRILAYVIMPNHIHLVIYFPEENRLSDFMRDFKKFTSVKIRQLIDHKNHMRLLQSIKYEKEGQRFKVWTDRFDDVYITKRDLLLVKVDYIHNNPLQEHWQLAETPEDYLYSSAAYYELGRESLVNVTSYSDFF